MQVSDRRGYGGSVMDRAPRIPRRKDTRHGNQGGNARGDARLSVTPEPCPHRAPRPGPNSREPSPFPQRSVVPFNRGLIALIKKIVLERTQATVWNTTNLLIPLTPPRHRKTWNLVSDPNTDHIVSWTADGRTFTVWNPDMMEKEQVREFTKS